MSGFVKLITWNCQLLAINDTALLLATFVQYNNKLKLFHTQCKQQLMIWSIAAYLRPLRKLSTLVQFSYFV